MALDPFLDVVRFETEMTTEPVVGDRIAVTTCGAPIDERLRNAEDFCDLFDVQVARREEEFKLLRRLCRLFLSSHASTSTNGGRSINVARLHDSCGLCCK
jgi:hypothetical protein